MYKLIARTKKSANTQKTRTAKGRPWPAKGGHDQRKGAMTSERGAMTSEMGPQPSKGGPWPAKRGPWPAKGGHDQRKGRPSRLSRPPFAGHRFWISALNGLTLGHLRYQLPDVCELGSFICLSEIMWAFRSIIRECAFSSFERSVWA